MFLAASIVAALLTPDGIFVAADTARRSNSGFGIVRKIVVCGERSVVALTGTLGWSYNLGERFIEVNSRQEIADACAQIRKSSTVSIRGQADLIARALLAKSRSFPVQGLDRLRGGLLHHVTVAGYEGTVPKVVQVALYRVAGTDRIEIGLWNEAQACVSFSGYDSIGALRDGRPPVPAIIAQLPSVRAVRDSSQGRPCRGVSEYQAKEFFGTAVNVSLDYADRFERPFDRGEVNWPIDFTTIRSNGVDPIRQETKPVTKP